MKWSQIFTLIGALIIPIMAGIGWVISWIRDNDKKISEVDNRLHKMEAAFEERVKWESRNREERK